MDTRSRHRSPLARPWLLAASTLVALGIGIAGYVQAPAGTPVAIHFGAAGVPNGWASPARAFFTAPAICAALLLLQVSLPAIKPSADRLEKRLVGLMFGAIGIILVVAQAFVFVHAGAANP